MPEERGIFLRIIKTPGAGSTYSWDEAGLAITISINSNKTPTYEQVVVMLTSLACYHLREAEIPAEVYQKMLAEIISSFRAVDLFSLDNLMES